MLAHKRQGAHQEEPSKLAAVFGNSRINIQSPQAPQLDAQKSFSPNFYAPSTGKRTHSSPRVGVFEENQTIECECTQLACSQKAVGGQNFCAEKEGECFLQHCPHPCCSQVGQGIRVEKKNNLFIAQNHELHGFTFLPGLCLTQKFTLYPRHELANFDPQKFWIFCSQLALTLLLHRCGWRRLRFSVLGH